MGKRGRRAKRILIGTGISAGVGYLASPKIQRCDHETKNHLIINLDQKKRLGSDTIYATQDQETNIILDLLSGVADKGEVDKLLQKYGYDNTINIDQLVEPDSAMYLAIWQMHQRYGNPNITLSKAYSDVFTGKEDFDRAHFNGFTNTIDLHKLDSQKIDFRSVPDQYLKKVYEDSLLSKKANDNQVTIPKSTNNDRQRYLINNWIAELAHSKARNEDGPIRAGMDALWDEIKVIGGSRERLYKVSGNYEYEAHKVVEPKLCQEFIDLYKAHSNLNNPDIQYKVGIFYNGYFDEYKDLSQAENWLHKAAKSGHKEAHYILGARYWKEYVKYYSKENIQEQISNMDTTVVDIIEKISSDKENALQNVLFHFSQSARSGSIYAYKTLIDICTYYDFPAGKKIGIGYCQKLIAKLPVLLKQDKTYHSPHGNNINYELVALYDNLSLLYEQNNQPEKAQEACDMANKLGMSQ